MWLILIKRFRRFDKRHVDILSWPVDVGLVGQTPIRGPATRCAVAAALAVSLVGAPAHGQVNDSTSWTNASYPDLGFAAAWPDNWKVTGAPSPANPRLIVQKNFEAARPDEGCYCKIDVSPTPATGGMSQAALDADTASKHPTNSDVAAVLRKQGSDSPQVYNTGIYPIAGHPAVTYETMTTRSLQSGQTVRSYILVASVPTPGRQYNLTCGSVTLQEGERAHMLFQLSSQSILGFMGRAKIF